jgi:hypothetical protein
MLEILDWIIFAAGCAAIVFVFIIIPFFKWLIDDLKIF